MIKSMTGYGRGEYRGSDRSFSVELRSVNHRYLETSVKLPRRFAFAEEDIKKEIKSRISRGKLDVFVNYAPGEESESAGRRSRSSIKRSAFCAKTGRMGLTSAPEMC